VRGAGDRLFGDGSDYSDGLLVTVPPPRLRRRSASRLSAVRGFVAYLHALDDAHQVPPADLCPNRPARATPYLYSEQQIAALMAATVILRGRLRQATYRTLIGLLAVTGMRVGEAIRLDRDDVDLAHGVLTVRDTKFGKSRELSVHPSTVKGLRDYARERDRLCPAPTTQAVLVSQAGTRLLYCAVHATFKQLRDPIPVAVARPGVAEIGGQQWHQRLHVDP